MQIEFTKDTKVNNTLVKKGDKLSFTDGVAAQFIAKGVAKKPTVSKKVKK